MRGKKISLTGRLAIVALGSGAGLVFWFIFGIFFLPSVHANGFMLLVIVPAVLLGLTCIISTLTVLGLLARSWIVNRGKPGSN